jgi:hypothetical protein
MKMTNSKAQNKLQVLLVSLAMVAVMAVAAPFAAASDAHPETTIANLAGNWEIFLYADSTCGNGTHYLIITLNAKGFADDFADSYNTSGCGLGQFHSQTFQIDTLNADGTGTATYSNNGTPLTLSIQVNVAKNVFIVMDNTDAGEYWLGTALKL